MRSLQQLDAHIIYSYTYVMMLCLYIAPTFLTETKDSLINTLIIGPSSARPHTKDTHTLTCTRPFTVHGMRYDETIHFMWEEEERREWKDEGEEHIAYRYQGEEMIL